MKSNLKFVVLDTETGGLDPLKHSLLSVGLVDSTGQKSLGFFVCEPEISTDPESMAINRLDLDQVRREGLTPLEATERLDAFMAELSADTGARAMVVGHNIAFDIAFLRRLYHLANRPFPQEFSHRTVDTHSLLWALCACDRLPEGVTGSDAAFAHFHVSPPAQLRHTALGDAWATRSLLLDILQIIDSPTNSDAL